MRVFWQGRKEEADAAETRAIAGYRKLGCQLFNETDGGPGIPGYQVPEKVRQKMSAATKGRPKSAATRERMKASWTPERRQKFSERMQGHWKNYASQ